MNRKIIGINGDRYVCFGSLADVNSDISLMTAFGGKADVQGGQFCENLGDIPECPLFSKADVRASEIHEN